MRKKLYRLLPTLIRTILLNSDGWLTGSSMQKLLDGEKPRDYDLFVSDFDLYQNTCLFMKSMATSFDLNSRGGMKFIIEGIEIDIWPQNLEQFMKNASHYDYLYNFRSQILITTVE